ncbi:uncharacterized protein CIMG_05812 [Coccidioides immitis RS]|uniref:Uncharacterized protein n=1 Tax=Coccidioides immitis (strain RS) TaxID=246410 RepID=J3K6U3_COCIM|nr:uncharacterized protein CIMG_05812 [Coccidioides immitis RS]EAS30333.3 hypothetical protein CIMG_05812 [Coccidioides immitis RS]
MASTEAEPRSVIVIDDDTDAETPRSPPRELRRKRRLVDYSLPEYEALFDGPALLNSSASTTSQPPKKRKIPNLKVVLATANQEIHTIFEAESAKIGDLQEEVRRLKKSNTELEIKHRAELIRKNEKICKLEAESGKPSCAGTGSAQGASLLTQRPVDHVVEISLAI